ALVVGALLLDLPVPVNGIIVLAGLLGGIVVFALLAAASTPFTRNVEFAQISTMPVLLVCLIGSGALVPLDAVPDQLGQVLRFVPLAPVVGLLRIGWIGGPEAVGFAEAFSLAGQPFAILVAWTVLGWIALRRWFR